MIGSNKVLKVVILGDLGVGKSCLLNRFVNNKYVSNTFSTVGVGFDWKTINLNGDIYTLQIWDTAGAERFQSLRGSYYRGADICMLTFAVNNNISFKNLTKWKNEFLYYADVKDANEFPFIVAGNKIDLDQSRTVSLEEAQHWCDRNGNHYYIETSAKEATNVDEAFKNALKTWIKLEAVLDKPYIEETVDLSKKQSQNICC